MLSEALGISISDLFPYSDTHFVRSFRHTYSIVSIVLNLLFIYLLMSLSMYRRSLSVYLNIIEKLGRTLHVYLNIIEKLA